MTGSRLWIDGEPAHSVPADSRALHYGDGVFRTLLRRNGTTLLRAAHLQRLLDDGARLGIRPPDPAALQRALRNAETGTPDAVLKLMLVRSAGDRGYRPQRNDGSLLIHRYPPPAATAFPRPGARVFRCNLKMAHQPALAGIKHLNRLEQVLASRDWPAGADEGILCDQDDRPVCGTRSNLFWIHRARLHTPALTGCGVAGVMRDRVLALAADLDIATAIGATDWDALLAAEEVFLTNSLIGIWPVSSLGARQWPAPGPVTARLQSALAHPASGS
jgi:aminodeoxychorismate lyase